MTILQAIQANPVFTDIPVNHIQAVLNSRLVDGCAVYSKSALKEVELVTADLYLDLTLLPDFKEGQLALKYNSALLIKRAKNLYLKYGDSRAKELESSPVNVGIATEDV